jgi:signal transduction histidine kinase
MSLLRAGVVVDLVVGVLAVAGVVRAIVQPIEPRLEVAALALCATLPLLLRRRAPLVAPLAALLIGCLGLSVVVPGALWEQLQFFFCALLCSWCLAAGNGTGRALAGLGAALGVALASVLEDPVHHTAGDLVFGLAITAAAWTGGLLYGQRSRQASAAERQAERLAAERRQRTAEAVADERARIARELHDVIGHTVSLMVVQAGAAQQVLGPGEEQARAALEAIRQSGKGALAELRHLLGLLSVDGADGVQPQPSLSQAEALVDLVTQAGTPVTLERKGSPRPLTPGLDQAAFRILQEALTNTVRHAGPARATVEISWEPSELLLSVTDDGCGSSAEGEPGRGLIGMRERARLYGGELDVGPRAGGGFRVIARLPA